MQVGFRRRASHFHFWSFQFDWIPGSLKLKRYTLAFKHWIFIKRSRERSDLIRRLIAYDWRAFPNTFYFRRCEIETGRVTGAKPPLEQKKRVRCDNPFVTRRLEIAVQSLFSINSVHAKKFWISATAGVTVSRPLVPDSRRWQVELHVSITGSLVTQNVFRNRSDCLKSLYVVMDQFRALCYRTWRALEHRSVISQ